MAHGGNHYSRTVAQLESQLGEKLAELTLLEQENKALRLREQVLSSSISTLDHSLNLGRSLLAGREVAGGGGVDNSTDSISPQQQQQQQYSGLPAGSACSSASAATTAAGHLLASLSEQQEGSVRQVLQQPGWVDERYDSLYSAQLLRRAAATPGRAAAHLAMAREQRLGFASLAVQRMAVLLPKCPSAGAAAPVPVTAAGGAQQRLENAVDELLERLLTWGVLDRPEHMLDNLLVNMETYDVEPYPKGWWLQVAKGVPLAKEQLRLLQISWPRVRAARDFATSTHKATTARLSALGSEERARAEEFAVQAEHSLARLAPAGLLEAQLLDALCQAANEAQGGASSSQRPAPAPGTSMQQPPPPPPQQQQHASELDWQLQHRANYLADELLSCPVPARGRADTMSAESSDLAAAIAAAMADEVAVALAGPGDGVALPAEGGASSQLPVLAPPASRDLAGGGGGGYGCPSQSACRLASLAEGPGVSCPRDGPRVSLDWPADVPEELLLPVLYSPSGREQCSLEHQLNAAACRVKLLHHSALATLCNVLTKKQLAQLFVLSFPYIPDAYSFMDALEELGALAPSPARRVAALQH